MKRHTEADASEEGGQGESSAAILERLRTDAAQARAIQDVATGSFLVSHREGQQRRLRAIEDLWNATLRIRESIPNIVVLQDIFTREEYPQIFTREKYAGSLEELTLEGIGTALYGASRDVESSRPFVGDYLWSLFFAYRAIMGRFWVLLVFGREDASNIVHWSMDSGVRQLLEAVLTSSELDEIYKARLGGVESTRKTIEAKILNAANRIISGEEASKLGLDQAKKIAAAASAVELRSRQA